MPQTLGEPMKRRSRAGGEQVKTRRRKAVTAKGGNAPRSARGRSPSAAGQETEVARLTRELHEALEQQTATSEVLRVISSSPTEIRPVLDAVGENAARLCEAKYAVIFRLEGELLQTLESGHLLVGWLQQGARHHRRCSSMVANRYEAEDPRPEPDIEWPGLAADIDGRRDIANAILADQSGADHGEAARRSSRHGYYRAQFESAWARYCAEGVTASQPSNVAYIGNR